MCGRFVVVSPPEVFRETYGYPEQPNFPPRYNVAPTQPVPVVTAEHGRRRFVLMRWGFLPAWVEDPKDFPLVINARIETAAEKPSFRNALRYRRCVFLADGFYEWRRGAGRGRAPFLIRRADRRPMALAGLWETWSGKDGSEIDTAAIVTCAANGTLAAIHERMPAILDPTAVGSWLDIREVDAARAAALCRPCPDEWLDLNPVGPRVNDVRNDDPGLMEVQAAVPVREVAPVPEPEAPRQGSLF
ncbi:SOS response-associated peptidase [uncultured Methylobacterium sp.]|jgi:putative SOS response-associated peptidase YedK|uniref:SOS response-associated peptidase n=1 Tax=uncultured Methylobacterium sp. TaxID=157278 RepID=UPI00261F23A0|nr:SOS response-associated peptidase [uncultured Methylobacterium sp.]